MDITYTYPGIADFISVKGIREITVSLDYNTGAISYMLLHKSGQAERLLLPITTTIVIDDEE